MALIYCPECGKEISDKAQSCPKCGFPLPNTTKVCPECKSEVSSESKTCPTCGFPFNDLPILKTNLQQSKDINSKNKILGTFLVIVGVILIILGIKSLSSDNLRFYKNHLEECIEAQAEVDLHSGSFYRSISREYDDLISYDKKKITGLMVKGMSFVGVGIILCCFCFLLQRGIVVIFKEKSNGIN